MTANHCGGFKAVTAVKKDKWEKKIDAELLSILKNA